MPAEWAPHERTLIAWPAREEAWRGTSIGAARVNHAAVVEAVARFEPVTLVANPEDADGARNACAGDNVEVVELPIDDSWLRDSGPIIVTGADRARAGVDFSFNAWGEAFTPYDRDAAIGGRILGHLGIERHVAPMVLEGGSIAVDGEGTLITTEQCLLNPNRNPGMGRGQIELILRDQLGAERIIWLGQGLVEDADTDGHVDNIFAFLEPGRALLQTVADESDPNWDNVEENIRRLEAAEIEVVELELLPRTSRDHGESVVIPYTNFYLCNGGAIVPISEADPEMDCEAIGRLQKLMPDREIVAVPSKTLALGGGGIHCITQQVPVSGG